MDDGELTKVTFRSFVSRKEVRHVGTLELAEGLERQRGAAAHRREHVDAGDYDYARYAART